MKKILKNISFFMIMLILLQFVPFKLTKTSAYNTLKYGIDVSSHQGNIDWSSVGTTNIDFAIIRTGTTNFNDEVIKTDSYFTQNYSGAKNNNIKVGAYYFTSAFTRSGMIQNAYDCLNILDGRTLDYPIFVDIENDIKSTKQIALGKSVLTDYLLDALKVLNDAGYKAGVYSNKSFLESYVDIERIRSAGFYIWMAQYPSGSYAIEPKDYDKSQLCSMWQYSDRGSVNGINGNCDVDVCYTDFEPVPEPSGEKYIVATESSNLYMRSEPKIGDNIIGSIPKDSVVTVLQILDDSDWTRVYYNYITGYCSTKYLKKIGSEDEKPDEKPDVPNDTHMLSVTTQEINLNMKYIPNETIVFIYQNIPDSVKAVNMEYSTSIENIVDLAWEEWNANTLPLNISGKNCGETDITVSLKNLDTDEVMDKITVHVTVKNELPLTISQSYEHPENVLSNAKLNMSESEMISGYIIIDQAYPEGNIICSADENSIVETKVYKEEYLNSDKKFFKFDFYPKKIGKERIMFTYMINDTPASATYIDFEVYSEYAVLTFYDKNGLTVTMRANVGDELGKYINNIEHSENYDGNKFIGWYDSQYGGTKYTDNMIINSYDEIKLYAHYENNDEIKGDANKDGKVTIADALMLKKWLLGTENLICWKNVDLCEDGKIDVFDMIEMKKILIEKNSQSEQ